MQTTKKLLRRRAHLLPGFSLIELLVVCAILALLATIGISTLAGSKTQGIEKAGNTSSSLAQLARQHAVSMNSLTALVVAKVTEANQSAWAVSIWDFDSNLKGNQVERWTLLPGTVDAKMTNATSASLTPTGITYRNATIAPDGIFWFYPDGRVGDGSAIPTLRFEPLNGTKENFYELVFNPVIGTHKINRP